MCETIFPLVSVGSLERDSVCEVLPVTIRLDAGTWDILTEHLIDMYAFGMPEDTPPLDLRTRIRTFVESFLENHMQARDYLLNEANGSGA